MNADRRPDRSPGFTLVEMLVIVGIVAVLAGFLLPALGGALDSSRKMKDLNRARQVGVAWALYSAQSDDRLLPGYLSEATQQAWNVHFRYHDGTTIDPVPDEEEPVDPDTGNEAPPIRNITGPWTWRLLPYLDYDFGLVMSHRGENMTVFDPIEQALVVGGEPAFGYNGAFMGGFWVGERYWFGSARSDDDDQRRLAVVSTTLGSVRRPSDLVAFASSAERGPGIHTYRAGVDDFDGSFIVLPPRWGEQRLWGRPSSVEYNGVEALQVGDSERWFGEFAAVG